MRTRIVLLAIMLSIVGMGVFLLTKRPESSTELNLANTNLASLKVEVLRQNLNINTLDVSHNSLTGALPAEIRELTALTNLDASFNKLTGIPAEVGQLRDLADINFSNNQIDALPDEFANLPNMRKLNLANNNFREFPGVLLKINRTFEVDMSGNPVDPQELSRVSNQYSNILILF